MQAVIPGSTLLSSETHSLYQCNFCHMSDKCGQSTGFHRKMLHLSNNQPSGKCKICQNNDKPLCASYQFISDVFRHPYFMLVRFAKMVINLHVQQHLNLLKTYHIIRESHWLHVTLNAIPAGMQV